MSPVATLSFSVRAGWERHPKEVVVTPSIDDKLLTELVSAFEAKHHFEPLDGYGGLIPDWFNYGPLDRYFMADIPAGSYWVRLAGIYVLGCECGEVGCWPLVCRVTVEGESVTWDRFRQPHRPERNYSEFGPFVFNLGQYQEAIARLVAEFKSRSTADS